MRFVVIPTWCLGQLADAYADREDAVEAALRASCDCTLLEVIGEATCSGQSVYKPFPQQEEGGENASN